MVTYLPRKIIVYKDGQFESTLDTELRALRDVIMSQGCDPDFIAIQALQSVQRHPIDLYIAITYFKYF
jgi:hypothetical protein